MRRLRIRRKRRGATLVEFGLCAIVFLTLLFGIMDWAWTFYQYQTIVWRASDGARWAAANSVANTTTVQNMVKCGTTTTCASVPGIFTGATISVSNPPIAISDQTDPTTTAVGVVTRNFVRVTVSGYSIQHFIPGFSGTLFGKDIVVMQPMECQDATGNCTYTP